MGTKATSKSSNGHRQQQEVSASDYTNNGGLNVAKGTGRRGSKKTKAIVRSDAAMAGKEDTESALVKVNRGETGKGELTAMQRQGTSKTKHAGSPIWATHTCSLGADFRLHEALQAHRYRVPCAHGAR